jgi:ATP-dependent helicase/nuclease subunit A
MPETVPHEMILASAGSGKTHTLAVRFIRLLALGADPRRIVALTFTRKAAGEFLARILQRLARAATDPRAAADLARETGHPALDPARARQLLRGMIRALPQLHLSTLDSFFHEIVKVFAFELGIDPGFQLLDPRDAALARDETLNTVFRPADEETRNQFMQAWKHHSYGGRSKTVTAALQTLLESHHSLYLECREPARWAPPLARFPRGARYLAAAEHYDARVAAWAEALAPLTEPPKFAERLHGAALDAIKWSPGVSQNHLKHLEFVLPRLFAQLPLLESTGTFELEMFRARQTFTGDIAAATLAFLEAFIGRDLLRAAASSSGLHPLIADYERVYETTVRGRGLLTFPDLPHLLRGGATAHDLTLAQTGAPADGRLLIDYRLDARFDHWLLDEFQDTSLEQWDVLANLLDEVLQDTSGERSFFVVGDIKQSIYGWRGGDSTLFASLRRQYGDRLTETTLDRSFRSGPAVIDFLNTVFAHRPFLQNLPPPVSERWLRDWHPHATARPQKPGCVAAHFLPKDADRAATTASMIRRLDPRARGLSCAVLVRRNKDIHLYIEALRAAGIPAVREGEVRVATDNPIGLAFLATLQALARPADPLPWAHLALTPLAPWIAQDGRDAFLAASLRRIHAEGFTGYFATWCAHLRAAAPPGPFGELRIEQIREACLQLDRRPERDCARAATLIESHALAESASPSSVQVMTVHKAKGLGFDVVFLPEIDGDSFGKGNQYDLLVARDAHGTIDWISGNPSSEVRRHLAPLAEIEDTLNHAAAFEEICVFYVACTRAAHALYLLAPEPPKSTSKVNALTWLHTLPPPADEPPADPLLGTAPRLLFGDPAWFEKHTPAAAPAPIPAIALPPAPAHPVAPPLPRARPSAEAPQAPADLAQLLAPGGRAARRLGSTLHAALAALDWLDPAQPPPPPPKHLSPEARALYQSFLATPAARTVFTRPPGTTALWREQPFDVILDGTWTSGIFDRVVLGPTWALIDDFKTDHATDPSLLKERHTPQLHTYRSALAQLTGLPEAAIRCRLVLVRTGELVEVAG